MATRVGINGFGRIERLALRAASGALRTPEQLDAYFAAGVKKVIVAAPVKGRALNGVIATPGWRAR